MGSCPRSDSVPSLGKGRAAGGLDAARRWRWPHSADRCGSPPDRSEACCRCCNPSSPSLCCQSPALKHSNTASVHSQLSTVAVIYSHAVYLTPLSLSTKGLLACLLVSGRGLGPGADAPALLLLFCCSDDDPSPRLGALTWSYLSENKAHCTKPLTYQHTALNHWHISTLH